MNRMYIGVLIVAFALLIVVSLVPNASEPEASEPQVEPISFSYGYGTQMVEKRPFGEDGPVVVGCEGVYVIE